MPGTTASSRRYSTVTLSRSLKVGTTTDNSGAGEAACWVSEPGLIASFMTAAYIRRVLCCQELVLPRTCLASRGFSGERRKRPKNANNPGTAGRGYIRRSLCYSKVVPAPEFFAQRRRYKLDGNGNAALQGAKEALFTPLLVRDFLDHRPSRHGRGRGRRRRNGGRVVFRGPGRLAVLADRPEDDGHRKHYRRDDRAQNAPHRLR